MINKLKKPKLSIITISFNADRYIERTINSIINQTYENIEYIIVDGASTDKTIEIIEKYRENINFLLSEKDNGIYDAMNKGISLTTGDFIWFMNSGDEIYDVNTVKNIFENHTNEEVYYGKTQLINEDGSYASITKVPKNLTSKNFIQGMVVSHQSIIFSTKNIDKYQLIFKIVSDQDWVISGMKRSKNIKNTNLVLSKYLLGGFSNKNFYNGWKERLKITYIQYGFSALLLNYIYLFNALIKKTIRTYWKK